ncbi:MAG TPA: hypothetical protein VFX05_12105 [Casimicrobiaceae bacterium]|nr:hypothetical protein [Casimicrobiaceae bacterium]
MRHDSQGTWIRFHPVTRIVIGVASVLILAFGAGIERIGLALASFSPAGSFEKQCGDLPSSAVDVVVMPPRVIENRDTPFDALTRLSEGPSPEHRTIGLTLANFGHRSTFEVKGLEDRQGGRACVRPQVAVELYLRPLTVYVAREYSADPCRARVIREHEQRHVDVYMAYAQEAAAQLRDDLQRTLGSAPRFAASVGEAQRHVDRQVAATLEGFMREAQRTLAERQAQIDTPEEYERVRSSCQQPS